MFELFGAAPIKKPIFASDFSGAGGVLIVIHGRRRKALGGGVVRQSYPFRLFEVELKGRAVRCPHVKLGVSCIMFVAGETRIKVPIFIAPAPVS